jgi:hypothetical protein
MPFSDGNRGASVDARFHQVLLAVPQFRLTGTTCAAIGGYGCRHL